MNRTIHNVAFAALLIHTIGGCCTHHLHAACLEGCETGKLVVTEDSHSCDDHEAPRHQHHHDTEVPDCSFIVPLTGNPNRLPLDLDGLTSLLLGDSRVESILPRSYQADAPSFGWASPLRLHLLHGSLLL